MTPSTHIFFLVFFLVVAFAVRAQEAKSIYESDPYAKGMAFHDVATITPYLLDAEPGPRPAVLVCPGGGYSHLAMDKEGKQVAQWLNKIGLNAFVLKYRNAEGGYKHPVPLADASRAMRHIRKNAEAYRTDPHKIGALGFSAGGHLAATLGTHFDAGNPTATDLVERESSRPDFLILLYPVITFQEPYLHKGSRNRLLGETPGPHMITFLSAERQVSPQTPPTFLALTDADKAVPSENAVLFYLNLRKSGVPAELHIFKDGRHGLGLGVEDLPFKKWPELCELWLKAAKFLK